MRAKKAEGGRVGGREEKREESSGTKSDSRRDGWPHFKGSGEG